MVEIPSELTLLEMLTDTRRRFATRPDVGDTVGLLERLSKYFFGNPISDTSVASTGTSNVVSLPAESRAQAAVINVQGSAMIYSFGGANLLAIAGQIGNIGDTLILTGQASIQGFQFRSSSLTTCTLAITYFD